jgi:hypothetical protein
MDHKAITGVDLHVPGYLQSSDPGAVGAGKYWIDTTAGAGLWVLKVRNAADTGWETVGSGGGGGAPTTADYLVGTAQAGLSAEIVVGTTPGGELGGTWPSPTVDTTHSGSSHAGVVSTHEGLADPHTGYRLESADHSHASTGLQAGQIAHSALTGITADVHHTENHASRHLAAGADPLAIPTPTTNVYTSGSGNWSKPAGARFVKVRVVGAGGGSGGTQATGASTQAAASGGGGGGYTEKTYAASALGSTEPYVVGAGGSAGAAGANNGGTGGNSTFSSAGNLLTGSGGTGGEGASASGTGPQHAGGQGGAASGGDLNMTGGDGSTSKLNVGIVVAFGDGGGSVLGTRGSATLDTAGSVGHAYGGGAAGATSGNSAAARAGAVGGAGVVIVETYF